MDWRESIASGVPEDPTPGREGLRGEIIDELDDHLSCAMQRELRRTDDEAEARKAALERFGDPRKVAWQLWWDAVKEKVMRDRILLAAVAVITLASLAVSVAALRAVQQGQQVNQAVLAKLAELPQNAAPPATPELTGDWSMAVIRAVSDGDAKPMEGVTVQLNGHLFNAADVGELSAKTDEKGVAKIGPIKAGQYVFMAWTNDFVAKYENFAFYPGRTNEFTVVAPQPDRRDANVRFEISSPESLDKSDLVLSVTLVRTDTVTLGHWVWRPKYPTRQLYIDLDGRLLNVSLNDQKRVVTWDFAKDASESLQLPRGSYRVQGSELLVIEPERQQGSLRRLIAVRSTYDQNMAIFETRSGEETRVKLGLAEVDNRTSYRRGTLQELKDDAIKALAEKENENPSPKLQLQSP